MERWQGKIAVVTGASQGIGAAIAERLVKAGLQVIGLARNFEKLRALQDKFKYENGGVFFPKACDMSNKEEIIETFQWIIKTVGPPSILINNAGSIGKTSLVNGDYDLWQRSFDTNVMGLLMASRETINYMLGYQLPAGHIVNINSICGHGHMYIPGHNVYPATKHAVTNLSQLIRLELAHMKTKIKVSSISPGIVDTDIHAYLSDEHLQLLNTMPKLTVDEVADSVIYVLSTPPTVQITELTIQPTGEVY